MIIKRKQKSFGWVGNLFGAKNFQAARNLSNKGAMNVSLAQQATKEGTEKALAAAQKYTDTARKANMGAVWETTKGIGKAGATTLGIGALGLGGTALATGGAVSSAADNI